MNKLLILLPLLAGCSIAPLKPGYARIAVPNGITSEVKQPQNPKDESTQIVERITESNGTKTTERVQQKVGAAQKDVAREAAAKLAALRPLTWVGLLLFIFGVASAVYPPLKLIVGSVTTSAALAAAGLALLILPTLLVGHELLILGVAAAVVGAWFIAHRHGSVRGELLALKSTLTGGK